MISQGGTKLNSPNTELIKYIGGGGREVLGNHRGLQPNHGKISLVSQLGRLDLCYSSLSFPGSTRSWRTKKATSLLHHCHKAHRVSFSSPGKCSSRISLPPSEKHFLLLQSGSTPCAFHNLTLWACSALNITLPPICHLTQQLQVPVLLLKIPIAESPWGSTSTATAAQNYNQWTVRQLPILQALI